MKTKILLFFVTLCTAVSGHGQDTTGFQSFFGHETTVWHGVTEYYDVALENHLLRETQDTVVDGLVYKKIEYSKVFWYNGYSEVRDSEKDFYLREDTVAGKLWCRFPNEEEEFLVVDLSLSIGDTIMLRNYTNPYLNLELKYVVQDTATTDNRRTLVLECREMNERISFIEGVGCTNLFDYTRYPVMIASYLVCCFKDGSLVYHDSRINAREEQDCVIHDVGIEENEASLTITVFPNPCTDWIAIEGDSPLSIRLYNIEGHCVKNKTEGNGVLDMSDLPRGCYSLQIFANNQVVQRIIIKK
jgi:hypothetical protein